MYFWLNLLSFAPDEMIFVLTLQRSSVGKSPNLKAELNHVPSQVHTWTLKQLYLAAIIPPSVPGFQWYKVDLEPIWSFNSLISRCRFSTKFTLLLSSFHCSSTGKNTVCATKMEFHTKNTSKDLDLIWLTQTAGVSYWLQITQEQCSAQSAVDMSPSSVTLQPVSTANICVFSIRTQSTLKSHCRALQLVTG